MMTIYQTIEHMKNQTGLALARAFDLIGHIPYTEQNLANAWLTVLQQEAGLYDEGWYSPPPHGIITLFGKKADYFQRVCQPSFRPQPMWPADYKYEYEDIIVAYASPVQRQTHLIGDFGINLYQGENTEIIEHFENVLQATLHIAAQVKVGMPFKEIYAMGMECGARHGFQNNIDSSTDKTGTNIGHTIPLSYATDPTHAAIQQVKNFDEVRQIISSGRKFINSQEDQRVETNMAFTIEPRFSTDSMPNTWFHLTVILENGAPRICHGFEPVFKKFGMERLLKLLP